MSRMNNESEKESKSSVLAGVMNGFNPIKNKQLNIVDAGEFDDIEEIKSALRREVSLSASKYERFLRAEEEKINYDAMNIAGWYKGDLVVFHSKYLTTNPAETVIQKKLDLVVQDDIKINNVLVGDVKQIKDLAEVMNVYGEALVYITDFDSADPLSVKYDVIEPYRYAIEGDVTTIYAFVKEGKYKKIQVIKYEDTYVVNTEVKYFNKNNKLETESYTSIESVINPVVLFTSNNSIRKFKYDLAMIDVTETMSALDIRQSTNTIHADEKYFVQGKLVKKGAYRIGSPSKATDKDPKYDINQPEIRVEKYNAHLDKSYNNIANDIGVSISFLQLKFSANATATAEVIQEEKSINRINAEKSSLASQLTSMYSELYGKEIIVEIPKYVYDNIYLKAQALRDMDDLMSIRSKVKFLNPQLPDDEVMKEVVTIKVEKGVPLTGEEEEYAITNNILSSVIDAI